MCSIRVYEVGRKGEVVTDIYWDDSPANFELSLPFIHMLTVVGLPAAMF